MLRISRNETKWNEFLIMIIYALLIFRNGTPVWITEWALFVNLTQFEVINSLVKPGPALNSVAVDSRVAQFHARFLPRVASFARLFSPLTVERQPENAWQTTSFPWAGPKTFRWLWVFDKRSPVIGYVLWSSNETPRWPSTPAFRAHPRPPLSFSSSDRY